MYDRGLSSVIASTTARAGSALVSLLEKLSVTSALGVGRPINAL